MCVIPPRYVCGSPRANHVLRTVPPLHIAGYAQAHDDAVWDPAVAPGGESGLDSSLVRHAERGRAKRGREYDARAGLARPAASPPARAAACSPGGLQPLAAPRASPRSRRVLVLL